jgi:two-component system response regulator YesN
MRPNVLIVDDDPDSLSMIVRTLHAHLPEIVLDIAANAQNALRLMQETKYDVILTDIIMPGMDGLEFLQQARRLSPQSVVVLLTGGPLPVKHEALAEGAHAVVAKPFEVSTLVSTVADALHRANVLRQIKGLEEGNGSS